MSPIIYGVLACLQINTQTHYVPMYNLRHAIIDFEHLVN